MYCATRDTGWGWLYEHGTQSWQPREPAKADRQLLRHRGVLLSPNTPRAFLSRPNATFDGARSPFATSDTPCRQGGALSCLACASLFFSFPAFPFRCETLLLLLQQLQTSALHHPPMCFNARHVALLGILSLYRRVPTPQQIGRNAAGNNLRTLPVGVFGRLAQLTRL